MAEHDDADKTEEPSQRKLDDAREKGQVASSREIGHWFMLLAGTIVVAMMGPALMRDLMPILVKFLGSADEMALGTNGEARTLFFQVVEQVALRLAAPFAFLIAAAVLSGFVQHGFVFAPSRVAPDLSRISLIEGFKRLFSMKAVVEFLKGLIKISVVGAVIAILILPEFAGVEQMDFMEIPALSIHLQDLTVRMLIGIVAAISFIAALDYLYQRFSFLKSLRMSRQELKDEYRQSEGDPAVKSRLRQIRAERARRRMMSAVPESDVVVANPTHFAVALEWKPEKMTAPRVVAKGIDHMALRIREVAERHKVPVIENPPLARGLYAAADLDDEIPTEHYRAVAEIIGYIMRLKKRASI